MKIAYPHKAVALHAIPQIVLHIEMYGVSSCCPNVVYSAVAAGECSGIGDVAVAEYTSDGT